MKLIFLVFFLYTSNLLAQQYAVKCRGVIDTKTLKLINKKFIFIDHGLIKKLSNTLPGKGVRTVDASELFILPGLIDSHSHLFITQTKEDGNFPRALERETKLTNEFRTQRAKIYLEQYLGEGFTSLFDLGNSGLFLDAKLKNEIKDNSHYPSLYISGPGIATNKGQFSDETSIEIVKKEYEIVSDKSNFDNILKVYVDNQVDILKIYLDNIPGKGQMNHSTLKKILSNKYIRKFKKITYHNLSPDNFKLINEFKISNLEHYSSNSPPNRIQSEIFITPTDLTIDTLKKFNFYYPVQFISQTNITHMLSSQKNINLLFGPDFYFDEAIPNFNRASYVKKSLLALLNSGLSSKKLIQSLTFNPAKSLHIQNQIGQIRSGAMANLIGVSKNPLEDPMTLFEIKLIINKGDVIKK